MKKTLLSALFTIAFLSYSSAQQYGCPFVNAGPDQSLPCGSNCTTISATYLPSDATTAYVGSAITYAPYPYLSGVAPPYPFYASDDSYSGVIPIPFTFCFYGVGYRSLLIGNNGMLSFDISNAGLYNPWPLVGQGGIPSDQGSYASDSLAIMGPYMDIYPAAMPLADSNYINYATIGTAPCRKFVVSYYQVPFYNTGICPATKLTSQIVLYETTNVIEIYIGDKPTCSAWNGGLAVEGIQKGGGGTIGYAVPGRNNTVWTATNDGYRFTPSGASETSIAWYQGDSTLLGTTDTMSVCPPNNRSTSYVARVTYANCDTPSVVIRDTMFVNVLQSAGPTQYLSCPSPAASVTMNATGTGTWVAISSNPTPTTIANPTSATTSISGFAAAGTYKFQWSAGLCVDTTSVIVTNNANAGPDQNLCTNAVALMAAYGTGVWSALPTNPSATTITQPTLNTTTISGFTAGGAYSFVWTTNPGCSDTMVVNIPFFTVAMSAAVTTVCQYSNTTIEVVPSPAAYGPFQVTWIDSGMVQSPHSDTTVINSLSASSYFTVQVTDAAGCVLRDSILINTNGLTGTDIQASANPTTVCAGSPVQLTVVANPNSCGLTTSTCTAPGTTVNLGTGTSVQNGAAFQYPSPYGNYYASAHHQFLILSSEILAAVPSGGQIKSLGLDIGTLNGGSTLDNFTISLACVSNDSLDGNFIGTGSLVQVYTAAAYTPVAGWNIHTFPTPYDWDGRSNLVVDICFNNTSHGNINPKMVYTQTPFQSVWCTYSNDPGGECNVIGYEQGVPVPYAQLFDRPNIRLNMCVTDLTGANLQWTPATGPNAPTPTNLDTVTGHPQNPTNYTVALTNAVGCVSYSSVMVGVDTSTRLSFNNDTFLCSQQPVTLNAQVTGNVNPDSVTYTWTSSTGGTPPNGTGPAYASWPVNPSVTTLYTVSISSPGGCTLFDSMRVTLGHGLPVPTTVDSITCAGTSDGKIIVDMSAGTPPFSYSWTPAAGNVDSISNLGPGTYMVLVTDASGCAGRDTTTLAAPAPLVLTLDSTNILCFGNATGTVSATVTGGRPAYNYLWNPAAGTGASLSGLSANTYSLTVTDASHCTVTGTVQVTQPPQLVSSAASTNLSGAGTNDGTITLTTTGGTPGYTYTSIPAVTGLPNATNLDTGTYIITVCDANNCCVKDTAVITGPPPILITFVTVNNLCAGQCNGSATASGSGGVPPYTYSWVDVTTGNTPVGTTSTISNLCAGTYQVTLTDSNGLHVSKDTVITAPPVLSVTIDSTTITCYNAANGSLNAIPAGGTPTYTIVWNPGGSINPLTGQGPGMYIVQVTDHNGCPAADTAYLGQPAQLVATILSSDSVTCFGGTNGYANVAATGGTPPFSYSWTGSTSTDSFASDLTAGTHTVNITDSKGCTASATVTIGQPSQIFAVIDTTSAHCATSNDGSAIAMVGGGTPGYTYTWDGSAPTSVDSITGLSPGTHTVTVTDSKGCTLPETFVIGTQYTLNISMTADSVTCNGGSNGSAYVTVANGYAPYTYVWAPAGPTTDSATGLSAGGEKVTVTDAYGCTALTGAQVFQPGPIIDQAYFVNPLCTGQSNGKVWVTAGNTTGPYTYTFNGTAYAITDTVFNLAAGTYSFTVTDGKGCTKVDAVTLTDPTQLDVQPPAVTGISCANEANGIIAITASGATPPYTYAWSPGSFTASQEDSLGPATYTITVSDANGCSVTVSATLVAPPPISFTYIESDSTSCPDSADGHIVVNVVGGTPGNNIPYEYSINGGTYQQNHNFYNLPAGTYTVSVIDSPGCTLDTMIAVYQPLPVAAAINPQDSLITSGTSLQLFTSFSNPQGESINSYYWTPSTGLSCMDCQNPVASPYNNTTYTLVVNYGRNCITSATDDIRVASGVQFYIPNAFTPNGDGINDYFEVFGAQLESVGMTVFNRWGEKVFDSGDSQWASWDGTYKGQAQPTGVYVYFIQLVLLDGTHLTREGSITLIR